eukprot:CAMPEP_0172530108 /NCGR_PEP_ID=MMETSP1067-20121228/3955_1 /TAXON_ID=265564 ORGANISM="Thalassiosira punctigera, Strain Tpunct2005C2" /NCGR_SAMPLE_ID=MMETSP1067 /ASSEMBLY_ACC=CAM_ASM_000444 /LENGTH=151 /DNA_ID=CAMNT_0013314257 /DNA_START=33 /DNA_END=488 /DNA_ORIENTATION=-
MAEGTPNEQSDKSKEEILLAKRMFLGGCLGLPWLWICNTLYFRLKVFEPLVLVDYWPGQSPSATETSEDGGGGNGRNADGSNDGNAEAMERRLNEEMGKKELAKWVRRSTIGALVVMSLFVSWIIAFQVNGESFGPKWFVMSETDAVKTGW